MATATAAEINYRPGTTGFDRKSQAYARARSRRMTRQAAFDAICAAGHAPETARSWLVYSVNYGNAGHGNCLVKYSSRYPGLFLVKISGE